jgi:hypothetical protein
MAGPRKKFRRRPKKVGAKKRQRVKAQVRRLLAAGMTEDEIKKFKTNEDVRAAHRLIGEMLKKKRKSKKSAKK